MTDNSADAEASWQHLKPDSVHALQTLLMTIESDAPPGDLFETYVWSKSVLAKAMRARLEMHLPPECPTFWELRDRVAEAIMRKFGQSIPLKYLKVPYKSSVHIALFAILLEKIGEPVESAMLRVVTEDSVHTERRMRELRELGFDITPIEMRGIDFYKLGSLNINETLIPAIVKNNIRKDKGISAETRRDLESKLSSGN
ncbi:hypothetical protein ACFVUB_12940 [Streptomyces niveus]|uniref:hypothetical protein n=1 Tax=Streptomyces niveus TaxID=193462 RepID=UPI0036DD4435